MKIEKEMNAGIGTRLKKIRKTFYLSQSRMSRILNTSISRYSRMENGKVLPGIPDFFIVRKTFDISIDWLFSGSGEKFTTGFLKSQLMEIDEETVKPVEPVNELEHGQIQDLLYFISKDRTVYHKMMNRFFEVKMSIEGSNGDVNPSPLNPDNQGKQ